MKKSIVFRLIVFVSFLACHIMIFLYFYFNAPKYPVFKFSDFTLWFIIGNAILAILILLSVFVKEHFKRTINVMLVLIIITVISHYVMIIASGSTSSYVYYFYSETNDPTNYLNIDDLGVFHRIEEKPKDFLPKVFPAAIPADAENIEYEYHWSVSFGEEVYIYAKWNLPEESYNAAKNSITGGKRQKLNNADYFNYSTSGYYLVAGFYDDNLCAEYIFVAGADGKENKHMVPELKTLYQTS